MLPTNFAAWLPAKSARFAVGPAPYTLPRSDEIVVRNHAVAINPLDWIKQTVGNFVFAWIRYPFILGSDLAGEVVAVGSDVTRFRIGDRVLAHAIGTDPKRNSAAEGSFQQYTVVLARMTSPIPDALAYKRAAVLPLGLSTAACGLFERDQLALRLPSATPVRSAETVLVWGASSSVGSNAVQLAVAAGYDVIATASAKNVAYVTRLGARLVLDYHEGDVVDRLVAACEGTTLAGAFAIGEGAADACLRVVRKCTGPKRVTMATFPTTFGGRSTGPDVLRSIGWVRQFLSFTIRTAVASRFDGTRATFVFGSSLAHNDLGRAIYEDFLPRALAEGRYAAAPEPMVVGRGLEAIQGAVDLLKSGVSAAKVVVALE